MTRHWLYVVLALAVIFAVGYFVLTPFAVWSANTLGWLAAPLILGPALALGVLIERLNRRRRARGRREIL